MRGASGSRPSATVLLEEDVAGNHLLCGIDRLMGLSESHRRYSYTYCNIALSRLGSVTNCLSLRFSFSM